MGTDIFGHLLGSMDVDIHGGFAHGHYGQGHLRTLLTWTFWTRAFKAIMGMDIMATVVSGGEGVAFYI
jgi:hypothetical protein